MEIIHRGASGSGEGDGLDGGPDAVAAVVPDTAPDAVAAALAAVRAMGRPGGGGGAFGVPGSPGTRGGRGIPGTPAGRRTRGRPRDGRDATDPDAPRRGGYSSAHADATDPQRLGAVFDGLIADRGWQPDLAVARLFGQWAEIVGADIAGHCTPTALADGELKVAASSTAWATQLRLLHAQLLTRVQQELGADGDRLVRRITVSGPVAPSWKRGRFSVRGRGPRDTYG